MRFNHLIFTFSLLTIVACGVDDDPVMMPPPTPADPIAFNFLAHPRMSGIGEINPQLQARDWKEDEVLVLGGDLDNRTADTPDILASYDDLFEFSDPNTVISLGNHDYSSLGDWEDVSGHGTFYTTTIGKTVFFISDNQSHESSLIGEQLDLFNAVVDTISEAETFIFLSHKLLWLQGNSALEDDLANVPNGGAGDCWYCTNENNFYSTVYPKLVDIRTSGIQVICLAGDVGKKIDLYQKQTSEDIIFLANGWDLDKDSNKYLKFFHTAADSLRWELLRWDE